MKRILLISTGGTIAMKKDETGLAVPTADGEMLLEEIGLTDTEIQVETLDFKNLPSFHLSLKDLEELRKSVIQAESDGCDGVVITHGTDTMEETAYYLDLTLEKRIPVVVTGAQRNLSSVSSDVQLNLMDAFITAADDETVHQGVVIVFSSEIVTAREATKVHRTRNDTFKSPEFGPVGTIDNQRVNWWRRPFYQESYPGAQISGLRVDILSSWLGAGDELIQFCLEKKVDGMVIQGLGAGHLPISMLPGVQKAIESGIPVVLSSRAFMGRFLTDTYGVEGGEKHLRRMGVIFGEELTPHKARMKLLVLLASGYGYDQIRTAFEKRMYK